jgi:hypothetical protein
MSEIRRCRGLALAGTHTEFNRPMHEPRVILSYSGDRTVDAPDAYLQQIAVDRKSSLVGIGARSTASQFEDTRS